MNKVSLQNAGPNSGAGPFKQQSTKNINIAMVPSTYKFGARSNSHVSSKQQLYMPAPLPLVSKKQQEGFSQQASVASSPAQVKVARKSVDSQGSVNSDGVRRDMDTNANFNKFVNQLALKRKSAMSDTLEEASAITPH